MPSYHIEVLVNVTAETKREAQAFIAHALAHATQAEIEVVDTEVLSVTECDVCSGTGLVSITWNNDPSRCEEVPCECQR